MSRPDALGMISRRNASDLKAQRFGSRSYSTAGVRTAFPDVGLEYAVRRYDSFESDLVLLYGATLGPAGESESI